VSWQHPADRSACGRACLRDRVLHSLDWRALTTFQAGFALNTVGSLVNGLMPLRTCVAGLLMTPLLERDLRQPRL